MGFEFETKPKFIFQKKCTRLKFILKLLALNSSSENRVVIYLLQFVYVQPMFCSDKCEIYVFLSKIQRLILK